MDQKTTTRLTDRTAQTAKPRTETYDINDDRVAGLALRVHATGNKTWAVRLSIKGRSRVRREIGPYPKIKLKEARDTAEDWRALARQGTDPAASAVDRPPMTLREAADAWLEDSNARSRQQTKRRLELHVYDFEGLGKRAVPDIEQRDVARLLRHLRGRGLTAEVNRVRGSLSSLFGWLGRQGEVTDNPVTGTDRVIERSKINEDEGALRVLSLGELVKIWNAAAQDPSPILSAIVKCLIFVPLRREEWTRLRADEIDRACNGWIIRLPAARMKGKRPHVIPLPTNVQALIESVPETGDWVFSVKGERPFSGWSRAAKRLAKNANLSEPWEIHHIRRGVATCMGDMGIREATVARILAHSPRRTMGVTRTYDRSDRLPEILDALDRWATRFLAAVAGNYGAEVVRFHQGRRHDG